MAQAKEAWDAKLPPGTLESVYEFVQSTDRRGASLRQVREHLKGRGIDLPINNVRILLRRLIEACRIVGESDEDVLRYRAGGAPDLSQRFDNAIAWGMHHCLRADWSTSGKHTRSESKKESEEVTG